VKGLQEPQPLLGERQGQRAAARDRGHRGERRGRGALEAERLRSQRRGLEDRADLRGNRDRRGGRLVGRDRQPEPADQVILLVAPEVQGVDMSNVMEAVRSGMIGKIIDVTDEEDGEHVEIYVE